MTLIYLLNKTTNNLHWFTKRFLIFSSSQLHIEQTFRLSWQLAAERGVIEKLKTNKNTCNWFIVRLINEIVWREMPHTRFTNLWSINYSVLYLFMRTQTTRNHRLTPFFLIHFSGVAHDRIFIILLCFFCLFLFVEITCVRNFSLKINESNAKAYERQLSKL